MLFHAARHHVSIRGNASTLRDSVLHHFADWTFSSQDAMHRSRLPVRQDVDLDVPSDASSDAADFDQGSAACRAQDPFSLERDCAVRGQNIQRAERSPFAISHAGTNHAQYHGLISKHPKTPLLQLAGRARLPQVIRILCTMMESFVLGAMRESLSTAQEKKGAMQRFVVLLAQVVIVELLFLPLLPLHLLQLPPLQLKTIKPAALLLGVGLIVLC